MVKVYLSLGANLGNPQITLEKAIENLGRIDAGLKVSRFYQTKPVSSIPQPDFVNCCVEMDTDKSWDELFSELEEIEISLGKVRKGKEEPRLIDIDILFYGDQVVKNDRIEIPHVKWSERLFVLEPLVELVQEISVAGKRINLVKCMERLL